MRTLICLSGVLLLCACAAQRSTDEAPEELIFSLSDLQIKNGGESVAVSGLLALSLAYVLWYTGVQRLGSARTAIYSNLVPVVAIGGIDRDNAADIIAAGADLIAVSGALFHAADSGAAARALAALFQRAG